MKQISQETTVKFSCIELKEALNMLPLMNSLVTAINQNKFASLYNSLNRDERIKYYGETSFEYISLTPRQIEDIFVILKTLGFEATEEIKEPTIQDLKIR